MWQRWVSRSGSAAVSRSSPAKTLVQSANSWLLVTIRAQATFAMRSPTDEQHRDPLVSGGLGHVDDAAVDLDADARRRLRPLRRQRVEQALGERIGRRRGGGGGLGALRSDEDVGHRGASVAAGSGRLALSNADAKYRIPLVYGMVARRS